MPGRRDDGAAVTAGDLFEVYRQLSTHMDVKHAALRESLEEMFQRLAVRMDSHERDDRELANRLLTVETQRHSEAAEQARDRARQLREGDVRVGVVSLIVSSVISIGLWFASWLKPS